MGRFDTTKATINANIKSNGNQEITGSVLNSVLQEMVDGTDAQLTELSDETIIINEVASANRFVFSEKKEISGNYINGDILFANGNIAHTDSTAYGVVWVQAHKGKSYIFSCSAVERYSAYANIVTASIPSADKISAILSDNQSDGAVAINLCYTATSDCYIGMMVWDGATYSIEEQGTYKDVATKSDVANEIDYLTNGYPIPIDKKGWARIGEVVYEGVLADTYRMSDYIPIKGYGQLYAILQGNGTIDTISFYDKNKAYIADLSVRTETEETDYIIDLHDEIYNSVEYVVIGINSTEPQRCSALLTSELSVRINANESLYKAHPIAIDKKGWARIGEVIYKGNLADTYRMSDYIPIKGYSGVRAIVRGNGVIDTISFYDKEMRYIPSLSVVTPDIREYSFLFNERYENAAYITIGILGDNSGTSESYAELLPYNAREYEKNLVRIGKLLCIGDSLTNSLPPEEAGTYQHKWAETLCISLNIPSFSLGGGAGANMANVGSNTIYQRVMALAKDEDVDVITLWGGTNDWSAGVELGEFNAQVAKGTRDNTTFIGALCDCVEKIVGLYPKGRLILIGTTPRTWGSGAFNHNISSNNKDLYLRDYVDAVKKVAEWYGIPFLDLLRTSGINALNISQYMYAQKDNEGGDYYLHFNQYGEDYLGKKIASFIRTL